MMRGMTAKRVSPGHRLRFSTLKSGVKGITPRTLTLTVRNLERDRLLLRHCFLEVPLRVEYELTAKGASMKASHRGSGIRDHWPGITDARANYDALQDAPGGQANRKVLKVSTSK